MMSRRLNGHIEVAIVNDVCKSWGLRWHSLQSTVARSCGVVALSDMHAPDGPARSSPSNWLTRALSLHAQKSAPASELRGIER